MDEDYIAKGRKEGRGGDCRVQSLLFYRASRELRNNGL
jgi:hypothetical protein